MPIWIYAVVAAVIVGFGGGWQTHSWKTDAAELARNRQAAQDAKKAVMQVDRGAEAFEALKRSSRAREVVVEKEVIREIQDPANAAQCLSPGGMRILTGDLDASDARRGIAPALPAASAPG